MTQEPKDRNDAIDRLLGLSSQRNLLAAIDAANLRAQQKGICQRFFDFEQQVQSALAARENDLTELRQEAQDAGLSRGQMTKRTALAGAKAVAESLTQFTGDADLGTLEIEVPGDWTGLAGFDKAAKTAIAVLRGRVPGTDEQKQLLRRQSQLLAMRASLEDAQQRGVELTKRVRALDKEQGGRRAVNAKIAEASGRAAVINEAIQYLEGDEEGAGACPVCGTEVPGLLEKIRQMWQDQLAHLVERIQTRIEELKGQLKELQAVATQYQKLNDEVDKLQQQKADLDEQIGELLDLELGDDDPLGVVDDELKRLEHRLHQLGKTIQERQERLDAIEQDLAKVRLIRNFLHLEEKKQVLETIQSSDAFRQLEALRDQVAGLVEDAEAIKAAVATVAREEAEAKLTTAERLIDDYFRQLSRNPAVRRLKLAVTGDKRSQRNAYEITDQDGKDLTPFLSQGDLNTLALAIFLGLASAARKNGSFGFLMLDDPSQSLGTEHKQHLAQLLNKVARHRKLIVATMDVEFHRSLQESLTKPRSEYSFGKWSPAQGPSIVSDQRAASPHGNGKSLQQMRR